MERKKLKISILLPSVGVAGGVRSTVRISSELLTRGHKVQILYRNDALAFRRKLQKTYVKLRYGPGHDWLSEFKGQAFIYDRLDRYEFAPDEFIISVCNRTAADMWNLPENTGIKVFHCRGVDVLDWEGMLEVWRLPIPKIVVSPHLVEKFQKEVSQSVVGVAPNGVDTKEYFPCVPESERRGIGSLFGWGKAKDPASTLETMRIVGRRLPDVPRYMFSSGRRPGGARGINFQRLPSLEQARKIYSSCKVWFLSSISEGLPNPILEAMACGCAVVSTACGGPEDIIKGGENGFLVDVGNTQAMAYKIMLLYRNEQLRKKICANAMKTVQEYSWPKAAEKLEKHLYSIYENHIRKRRISGNTHERPK